MIKWLKSLFTKPFTTKPPRYKSKIVDGTNKIGLQLRHRQELFIFDENEEIDPDELFRQLLGRER